MSYKQLLENAPDQRSDEFIRYLKENNEVIKETKAYLIIANCKYDKPGKRWLTVFAKGRVTANENWSEWQKLFEKYASYEWLRKAPDRQTVKGRFHIHLYQP